MNNTKEQLSRRDLLSKAGTGAAVGMGLMAGILPVHAEPTIRAKRVGANDKVVLGLIGCGGMGAADMRALMDKPEVAVTALCDVDKNRMPGDIKDVTAKYNKA